MVCVVTLTMCVLGVVLNSAIYGIQFSHSIKDCYTVGFITPSRL